MVRRVKAKPVLMAQLFDDLSEGLFQIADFAAEVTTGGNLRQSSQKIHRFLINSDPNYYAVTEAAKAFGQTEAPSAFDTLTALLKQDSWQDTIRTCPYHQRL